MLANKENMYKFQKQVQDTIKHLWRSLFAKIVNGQKSLTIFAKDFIIDV